MSSPEQPAPFHAQTMPDLSHPQPLKRSEPKPTTKLEPFHLAGDNMHRRRMENLQEQIKREEEEMQKQRQFTAQPLPLSLDEPEVRTTIWLHHTIFRCLQTHIYTSRLYLRSHHTNLPVPSRTRYQPTHSANRTVVKSKNDWKPNVSKKNPNDTFTLNLSRVAWTYHSSHERVDRG